MERGRFHEVGPVSQKTEAFSVFPQGYSISELSTPLTSRICRHLETSRPLAFQGWLADDGAEALVCGIYRLQDENEQEGGSDDPAVLKIFSPQDTALLPCGTDKAFIATTAREQRPDFFSQVPFVAGASSTHLVETMVDGIPLPSFFNLYTKHSEELLSIIRQHTGQASEALTGTLSSCLPSWDVDKRCQRLISPCGQFAIEVDLDDEEEPKRSWRNWMVTDADRLLDLDFTNMCHHLPKHLTPVDLTVTYQLYH